MDAAASEARASSAPCVDSSAAPRVGPMLLAAPHRSATGSMSACVMAVSSSPHVVSFEGVDAGRITEEDSKAKDVRTTSEIVAILRDASISGDFYFTGKMMGGIYGWNAILMM